MSPMLLIRADATPAMGTGHVMRCLALAQAAQQAGLNAHLFSRVSVPWVRDRLARENIPLHFLDGEPPREERPEDLLNHLRANSLPTPGADGDVWLALDGYHFTLSCHQAALRAGYRLLVIDDYVRLPEYRCDILLNQNIGAETLHYSGAIGRHLLGLDYVLLRQEFLRERARRRDAAETPRSILVTLGGGDAIDFLGEIAEALNTPDMAGRTMRLVQGAMDAARMERLFAACPAKVEILRTVDDMPALLSQTDLCVSAGGTTCWELACLGVPFLIVQVADNQGLACRRLSEEGYAPMFSPANFSALLRDGEKRRVLSARLRRLVDGQGAARVIAAMVVG